MTQEPSKLNPDILTDRIDQLAGFLLKAKEQEAKAKALRLSAEEDLAELVGTSSEGTTTARTNKFKVSTVQRMNRKVDQEKVAQLREKFGRDVHALFPKKYSVSLTELRSLQRLHSNSTEVDVFSWTTPALQAITTTPGKVTVTVTPIEVGSAERIS